MQAKRDENRIPTLLGVSNVDGLTPVPLWADPTTHRLLVDIPTGTGDVTGPSSATNNAIVRFDTTTGKLIQNSVVTIADTTGDMSGLGNLTGGTGQMTITGGTAVGDNLLLTSTSNATKGLIGLGNLTTGLIYDEVNDRVGIGTAAPGAKLSVKDAGTGIVNIGQATGSSNFSGMGFSTTPTQLSFTNYSILGAGQDTYVNAPSGTLHFRVANVEYVTLFNNGNVGIGNSTPTHKLEITGGVGLQRTITIKTADYTVLTTDSNALFTNAGAVGAVNFTLPTAVAGLTYEFYIQAAQTLTITANTGDTIRNAGTVTSSGGTFSDNTVGNLLRITAVNATEWVTQSIVGIWTTV